MQELRDRIMHQNISELKPLFEQLLPQRFITKYLMDFLLNEGLADIFASLGRFSLAGVKPVLAHEAGYDPDRMSTTRMVDIVLDLLHECGFAERKGEEYRWKGLNSVIYGLTEKNIHQAVELFDGQINFFKACIDYSCEFLRGGGPLFRFDKQYLPAWEAFLGNAEFELGRHVLVKMLSSGNASERHVLDLCPGLGFDIRAIQSVLPGSVITALDFTDVFSEEACRRVGNQGTVHWADSSSWDGFGQPLPFDDNSFDIVYFACADPYIPAELREDVYRDIFRVLKRGGALGILTNSYPDPGAAMVRDPWIRRGIMCHDYAESVCEGWQGFSLPQDSAGLFRHIGFTISSVILNASLWRLDKP